MLVIVSTSFSSARLAPPPTHDLLENPAGFSLLLLPEECLGAALQPVLFWFSPRLETWRQLYIAPQPVYRAELDCNFGSRCPEEKSVRIFSRAVSMSLGLSRRSWTSWGEALRRTYSSWITSLKCAPLPTR